MSKLLSQISAELLGYFIVLCVGQSYMCSETEPFLMLTRRIYQLYSAVLTHRKLRGFGTDKSNV